MDHIARGVARLAITKWSQYWSKKSKNFQHIHQRAPCWQAGAKSVVVHIFKALEPICIVLAYVDAVFFILNASINSNFIQFLTQSGATCRKSASGFCCRRLLYGHFSARYGAQLLGDRKSTAAVCRWRGKIDAVHGLVCSRTAANFELAGDLIYNEAWRKVSRASGIGEWRRIVSDAFCSRTANTSNTCLNETTTSVQSISRRSDWCRKQVSAR